MRYSDLTSLLYNENPPKNIRDVIGPTHPLFESPGSDPRASGLYLVHHAVYGWCTYGFTVEHRWGDDDIEIDRHGRKHYKVTYWTTLDFLEEDGVYAEKFPGNV